MAKKNHYLNNRKLLECIVDYRARCKAAREAGKPEPGMPEYAGACVKLICEKMGTRGNFSGYTYREEMVGDAIMDCVHAFYNFDSDRFSNPFGYFSRVAWRAMIRKIFTEKKETYLKHKTYQLSATGSFAGGGDPYETPGDYVDPRAIRAGLQTEVTAGGQEQSNGVITDFEALLGRRREKREEKAAEKAIDKDGD